jgi:hypothetical protein
MERLFARPAAPASLLNRYQELIGVRATDSLLRKAQLLTGVKVLHVNSTREGGGVAEILASLTPLMNDVGSGSTSTPGFPWRVPCALAKHSRHDSSHHRTRTRRPGPSRNRHLSDCHGLLADLHELIHQIGHLGGGRYRHRLPNADASLCRRCLIGPPALWGRLGCRSLFGRALVGAPRCGP